MRDGLYASIYGSIIRFRTQATDTSTTTNYVNVTVTPVDLQHGDGNNDHRQ